MLALLSELDKAYTAKFEAQLEHARADMLSSSMTFQVVAWFRFGLAFGFAL